MVVQGYVVWFSRFWIFQFSFCQWYHIGQKRYLVCFQFLKLAKACFVTAHMIYVGVCFVYASALEWDVLYLSVRPIWFNIQFKNKVSLLVSEWPIHCWKWGTGSPLLLLHCCLFLPLYLLNICMWYIVRCVCTYVYVWSVYPLDEFDPFIIIW